MVGYLPRPARLSNALVLTLPLVSTAVLAHALLGPGLAVALLGVVAATTGGLAALSRGGAVFASLGTVAFGAGLLGIVGLLAVAVLLGIHRHTGAPSAVLPVAVAALTVGATVVAVGQHRGIGAPDVRRAVVGLAYLVVPVDAVAVAVAAFRLNLVRVTPDAVAGTFEAIVGSGPVVLVLVAVALGVGTVMLLHASRGKHPATVVVRRLQQVPWLRHQRRVVAFLAACTLPVGLVTAAPFVVELIRTTPVLHYSIVPQDGIVFYIVEDGIYFTEFRPLEVDFTLLASTEQFLDTFDPAVAQTSAEVLVVAPVALGLSGSLVALTVGWVGWVLLSRGVDGVYLGLALVFVGVVGAGTLGAAPLTVLGAAALVYLAWDLHVSAGSIGAQLDAASRTVRGESIHVTANSLVLVCVLAVAVAGSRAAASVPDLTTTWHGSLALVLAATAVVLAVVAVLLDRR
jgi:hypothetical protein